MHVSRHHAALAQALLVTILWSTSWILIKRGLGTIPPLTFAGLRYGLAFFALLPGLWRRREELRQLEARDWGSLLCLGVVLYALTQGGQFLALDHLDAIPLTLILSLTPALVALTSGVALAERPTKRQGLGVLLAALGALAYFWPIGSMSGRAVGLLLALLTLAANAAASVLGRSVNRRRIASPHVVTALSMGVGAAILLSAGVAIDGMPSIDPAGWGIIAWLAFVNTAFAFTLWNHTLRTLRAVESSVINNTMMIQIAFLAWVFLGERLSVLDIVGLGFVAAGTWIVQRRPTSGTVEGSAP